MPSKRTHQLGISFQDEQHGNGPRHYAATLGGAVFEMVMSNRIDSTALGRQLGKEETILRQVPSSNPHRSTGLRNDKHCGL